MRLPVRVLAFVVAALFVTPAIAAADKTRIEPGMPQYTNVENAIKFLREHGESQAADQIQKTLDDGDLYVDTAVSANGETDGYNNVSLAPQVAGNTLPFNKNTPWDPVKNFEDIFGLARTLYHENIHVNSQNLITFMKENWREYPAWTGTIKKMEEWIEQERAQFDGNYRPRKPGMTVAQQQLELSKIQDKIRTITSYYGDFKNYDYFDHPDDAVWVQRQATYWEGQQTQIGRQLTQLTGGGTSTTMKPTTPAPPAATPAPPPAPKPEPAPPSLEPVTVPCVPCQKIADQISDVKSRLNTLNENAANAEDAVTRNQQRIGDLQKRAGNLQAELERAAGTGGSSYDPSTGQTVDAYDQGNGTVKVTTKDAAGHIIDEHVRDSSTRKADINRQIDEANAGIAKAQAEGKRLEQAAATAKKLVGDMSALLDQLVAELADCIKKYCSNIPTAAALNLLGLPYRDLKTLGDPLSFNPPYTGGRNDGFQLMMIEIRAGNVDGIFVPGKAAAVSKGARHEPAPRRPAALTALLAWLRPGDRAMLANNASVMPWLPNDAMQQRRAPRVSPVQMLLTSLGQSTGEAFDLQVFNTGGKPFKLAAEPLVVEPLKDEAKKQLQGAAQRLMSSAAPVTAKINAYCMEFLKPPPALGTAFRIAAPELQQRFAPMRQIMDASRRVQQLGQLRPDSNPDGYFHSIRQWAMWTVEQKLNEKTFANAFVDHTKKAVTAQKQPWSNDTENIIRKAAPNRWNDIQKVLSAAGLPLPR
jgi:hypothetical protein